MCCCQELFNIALNILSETGWQIHLPRKQRLINRKRHRHTAIDRLSIIWKSNRTDKMKRSFFQAAVVSILLYGCTTWTLTKRLEKKLDGNYTRMWIHITFQYLGIVEGKQFKLYLSLTGFQCSDFFLSFLQVSDLSGVDRDQRVSLADFCPKLKILLQISLTGNGILARGTCEPIIWLFLLPPLSQVTPTWLT